MFIAQFFKASSLKKIRSITFIVCVLGRVKKNAKKRSKNVKNIFYTLRTLVPYPMQKKDKKVLTNEILCFQIAIYEKLKNIK